MSWARVHRYRVPRNHAAARRFYFDVLHVAHTRRERLEACLLRRLPPAQEVRLRLAAPPSRAAGRQRPGPDGLRRLIERALAHLPAPPTDTWILQGAYEDAPGAGRGAGGGNDGGRAVAFLFGSDDEQPAAVLKLRHRPDSGAPSSGDLEAEVAALQRLAPASGSAPGDATASSVPRLLGRHSDDELDAVLLTWLRGRSAYVDLYRDLRPARHVTTHLQAAATWLAAFHEFTSDGPVAGADRLEVPAAGHGDFWARNLLLQRTAPPSEPPAVASIATGKRPGSPAPASVVDWESYRPSASPLDDLFHFPLSYALEFPWRRLRRVPPDEAFRRGFLADNRVSRAIAAYLGSYARARDVDAASLEPRFHRYLLDQAHQARRSESPSGQRRRIPWRRFQELLADAPRSVFSSSSTR